MSKIGLGLGLGLGLLAVSFARVASAEFQLLRVGGSDARLYAGPYTSLSIPRNYCNANDWACNHAKAECGTSSSSSNFLNTIVGLSNMHGPWTCGFLGFDCFRVEEEGILCSTSNIWTSPFYATVLGTNSPQDQRDTTFGDWAYGYWKLECPPNGVMTGLSDNFQAICSRGATIPSWGPSKCNVQWANGGNSPHFGAHGFGDWDPNHFKAECAVDEYVKGVASADGQAKALLCCSP